MAAQDRVNADGTIKPVDKKRQMQAGEALELRDHYWPMYEAARGRQKKARDFISKKTLAPVPLNFKLAGVDSEKFRAGFPQQMTSPLKLRNMLASRDMELKWWPGGEGGNADELATNLEQWGEAGMAKVYPKNVMADLILNEGEGGSKILPKLAGWGSRPDPLNPAYRRDKGNNRPSSPAFDLKSLDLSKSSAAYERALNDHLARNFPFECEALSLSFCAPINPRWAGEDDGVLVDGAIIERELTVSELLRKRYVWWQDGKQVEQGGYGDGARTSMKLLETHLTDDDGLPWITYTVSDGARAFTTQKTSRDGTRLVDAQIDLFGQYGMCQSSIVWEYGWHWAVPEVGERSIPFIFPFIEAFLSALSMMTGIVGHTYATGFGGWVILRDPSTKAPGLAGVGPNMGDLEAPTPNGNITVGALEVVELEGRDLKPLVHSGPSPMAGEIIKMQLDSIREAGPPEGAFGGPANSGIDRTMLMRQLELAVWDVSNGLRRAYARTASNMLMCGYGLGKTNDIDIPIWKNVEVPSGGTRGKRNLVILHPDDCEGVYDFSAIYPTKPGDNLALAAQLWGFKEGGGITTDEWREWAFGDKHPEIFRAKRIVEQIENSPIGLQDVLDYVTKKLGDEETQARIKAMQKGQMGTDGTPTGLLAGLNTPAGGPGGGLAGLGAPSVPGALPVGGAPGGAQGAAATATVDPGQMALMGHVGGAMQASRGVATLPAPGGQSGPAPSPGI